MKSQTNEIIHKEVVIIGNGPSGIVLSYMLSGNLPYLKSDTHPDEMLSARLRSSVGKCLIGENLAELAGGLEGRSTNQISLLYDALEHPYADIGLELESLIEFRNTGVKIDHVVVGKGPPGGSWHKMDPYILTLSLGSWMALPGLQFNARNPSEKRAYAHSVAKYYEQYVTQMKLTPNFRNNIQISSVERFASPDREIAPKTWRDSLWEKMGCTDNAEDRQICFISNVVNRLRLRSTCRKTKTNRCRRQIKSETIPIAKLNSRRDLKHSISSNSCDKYNETSFSRYSLRSVDCSQPSSVPYTSKQISKRMDKWLVKGYDHETGQSVTYSCDYLVLATGANDLPNRLEISKMGEDPSWLLYDLRTLEQKLDERLRDGETDLDPVLIVGAGLSAADAVIAVRGRNIPVVHVFRSKTADLNKQLPENMYPEYHKVHQMMQDGGSTYPNYISYAEYNIVDLDEAEQTVKLESKTGHEMKMNISFAVILIGSRPDLSFVPNNAQLAVQKHLPIDCKTNTLNIDQLSYRVHKTEDLFAIGPLAGDNFVRFIPGGALAVVSELYRLNNVLF